MQRIEVAEGGDRLDRWLGARFSEKSRSHWQRMVRAGCVRVDGESAAPRLVLRAGQHVEVDREALAPEPAEPPPPEPENLPLSVLYEDDDILIIDKAAGMVVHPGSGVFSGTVVHAALHHCRGKLAPGDDPARPGIVHRLDRETSGVLVLAKSQPAAVELARQFHDRETEKRYIAVVLGEPDGISGLLDRPVGRHPQHRTRMTVLPEGRDARTLWWKIACHKKAWSVLDVKIETGRTHQIRVHLSSIGHPLLGDSLYGYRRSRLPADEPTPARILLHARSLRLTHPMTGAPLCCKAPPPLDMHDYLKDLNLHEEDR